MEILSNFRNQPVSSSAVSTAYEYFSDTVGSPHTYNHCRHVKTKLPAYGKLQRSQFNDTFKSTRTGYFDAAYATGLLDRYFDLIASDYTIELGFQRNDNFQLLNLLGEFDETLKIFSKSFWKSLSYGSINWGLLPFVNDVRSVYDSFDALLTGKFSKDLSSVGSSISRRAKYDLVLENSVVGYYSTFSGVANFHGTFSLDNPLTDGQTALRILLDEMGFHPDLRTIWDLIPLSFVADYFIPIGDALEVSSPRGWFNPKVSFNGNCSIKGEITHTYPQHSAGGYPTASYDVYKRYPRLSFKRSTRRPQTVSFNKPRFKQLANVGYVARQRTRRRSTRVGKLP